VWAVRACMYQYSCNERASFVNELSHRCLPIVASLFKTSDFLLNTYYTTRIKLDTFDVSTSFRGLHQKKLV